METGKIPSTAIPGPFDLQATFESGQTFRWSRPDEGLYEDRVPVGGSAWYRGVVDETPVELRQTDDGIEWRAPAALAEGLRKHLALTSSMAEAIEAIPDGDVIGTAKRAFPGLHVVDEPFFPTLVSFILSAQMRVERIHSLVGSLSERYGPEYRLGEDTLSGFPEPEALAAVSEADLRDLGLGYRAPYVRETAAMIATGELTADGVRGLPYEEAREMLTGYVGVGEKVADCVLLFSLGYAEPVPLDTWIETAIEAHFPEAAGGTYAATSRKIRERLQPNPGVAQTYLFHYLRHRDAIAAGDSGQVT